MAWSSLLVALLAPTPHQVSTLFAFHLFDRMWLIVIFIEVLSLFDAKTLSETEKRHFNGKKADFAMWARTILSFMVGDTGEVRHVFSYYLQALAYLVFIVKFEEGRSPLNLHSFHEIVRVELDYPAAFSMLASELFKIASAPSEQRGDYDTIKAVRALFS